MNKFISKVTMNWKVATAVAVFAVVALFGAPRAYQALRADTPATCAGAPMSPTLNPYPITLTNEPCKDWPAIWAGKNGQYPTSFEQLYGGWNAANGDEFEVRVYIHNGEPQGSPEPARGVNAVITVNDAAEPEHVIGSTVTSSNAGSVTGSFTIRTASDEKLEIVPGSAHIQNWFGQADYGAGSVNVTSYNGEPAVQANLNDMPGCFDQSKFIVFKVRVVKTQAPTPVNPTYSINAQLGSATAQCLYNGTIVWNTTHINDALVTVSDPDQNSNNYYDNDTVFARGITGNQTVGWIQPEKPYRFALWEVNPSSGGENHSFTIYGGSKENVFAKLLTESWIPAGAALNCGAPTPNQESFDLSVNPTEICVGQGATFTVQNATFGLRNKAIIWSSTLNGQSTGENNGYYGQATDGNGYWSAQSQAYTSSMIGSWTKTATINGISRTVSFRVKDCSTPPPTPTYQPLVCTFTGGARVPYSTVYFTATGGKEPYNWTAIGSTKTLGSGRDFGTSYSTAGTYQVKVISADNQVAYCNVTIEAQTPTPNPLTCIASATNIQVGQSVTFTAQGGEGTISWKLNNAAVGGNSATYTSTFNQAGNYVASVTRGSQTANCPVVAVQQPVQIPTLTCVASATQVQVGQNVTFTAQGGEGTYSWKVNGTTIGNNAASYIAAFSQAGTYNVSVTRGSQTANCPAVVVINPTPVCVANLNGVISASAITEVFGGGYTTNISWSFNGNNAVKVTYVNPDNGQEVEFVGSTTQGGSKQFSGFAANKDYVFKLYDLSNCGGLMSTFVLRKTVNTVCVPNSNFALNVTNVVKSGSTYSATLNWTSTGSHQIKIAQNTTGNTITTGGNTGSFTVTGLTPGSAYSFFMIDAECNTTLATATINIPQETTPTSGGNCNNSTNSCNNNNNTTTVTGNNNNTVTNNTNINGNNNTVNNVNTCVNNSCNNWYYITNQGNTVPANEYRQLSIVKSVRSLNGSYQNSVTVNGNDTVEFQITVTNTGNQVINNVRVTDSLPSGLSYVSGDFQNYNIGSLMAGQSRTLTFQARVNNVGTNGIQNIARASGDNASEVQDDAWVFVTQVAGGNVSLNYSKKAWNDTKNVDAQSTPAAREDFITYTLSVTNSGNTPANSFVITDDLSQVLPYADMVDNGGGQISGNVITYPAVTIPAGSTVTKSFKVRVKYYLAQNLSYVMTNTYGNTVTVRINTPQVLGAYVAPKTGSDATTAGLFAMTLTGLFAAFKKRETLLGLLLGQ